MVRVRFAPSPTGYLHLGGLRTALYNELYALRHGGVFLLRIEDTDRSRYVEGAVESLLRTLAWCGITPQEGPYLKEDGTIGERGDHGPYTQSQRQELYAKHASELVENGHAYRCFCTAERLEQVKAGQQAAKLPVMYDRHCRFLKESETQDKLSEGQPHVIRLRIPDEGFSEFKDEVRGGVRFENALIDDQVLIKSDGFPTYHLANVVDDHLMGVTHVIRAEEWLPSTPKHLLLYRAFGWEPPAFAHLPLLLNPDRSKLSKRQGDVAVEDYKRQGYLPEAMVNFVALLGWNPTADREIFAKEELAAAFDLSKINKGGAVFNREKLDWVNREYLKAIPLDRLTAVAVPFMEEAGLLRRDGDGYSHPLSGDKYDADYVAKALSLERTRLATLAEFPAATAYFFGPDPGYDPAIIPGKKSTPETAKDRLAGLHAFLDGLDDAAFADAKTLETAVLAHIKEKGWTNAESLWPLRVALTAQAASPSPFEVAWVLGKRRTLIRVENAVRAIADT